MSGPLYLVPDDAHEAAEMTFVVYGKAITQGSKVKTRWGMRDDNGATLKPWRDNVRSAALEILGDGAGFGQSPVIVTVTFYFARPATHYRTGRNAHLLREAAPTFPCNARSGDIDKLQRSCFDAMTDAGIWKDDAQVVGVAARKMWCTEAFPKPCARISIGAVDL